jgi:hypothetical protein
MIWCQSAVVPLMHKFLAVIVIWLLWPTDLKAADFKNRGAGATSCGTWTQEHRDKTVKAMLQDHWVFGFVTAEELYAETKHYNSPDNAALIAWIGNYCAKSPLVQVANAAFALVLELRNDPAELEKSMEAIRKVFRSKCNEGDSDACKALEKQH